jgi:AraC-like DNA-binding protein
VGDWLQYRSFYPSAAMLSQVAGQIAGSEQGPPDFTTPLTSKPVAFEALLKAHRSLERGDSALESETLFLQAMQLLIAGRGPSRVGAGVSEQRAVRIAKEYIAENVDRSVTLEEIANVCGFSRFYFIRMFRKATGLSPHEYLVSLRVERARRMLRQGKSLAEIAASSGFADQSHMIRTFRRTLGLTPGALARSA